MVEYAESRPWTAGDVAPCPQHGKAGPTPCPSSRQPAGSPSALSRKTTAALSIDSINRIGSIDSVDADSLEAIEPLDVIGTADRLDAVGTLDATDTLDFIDTVDVIDDPGHVLDAVDAGDDTPGPALPSASPAAPPRVRTRLAGRAPAPPSRRAAVHSVGAVTAVLLALVAIGSVIHEPVLIPPLAASAAIIHGAPRLPLAQPRSVILGHLMCVVIGYAVVAVAGSSPWGAAVAAGVSLAAMTLTRCPHSPACATAVVIVLNTPAPATFVPLLMGSTALLVLAGWALSRSRPSSTRYPAYWW
ncbi:HPP family protein [Streptomyces alfalfae]|nr:HPP family protein [Streptomyces fradiae]RXX42737.1 HPP family protein [Streptomyces alfalfae]RZM86436.1 HPP family protein [Streptomyces alfalfae]